MFNPVTITTIVAAGVSLLLIGAAVGFFFGLNVNCGGETVD